MFAFLLPCPRTNVNIHLDKINKKYNILHIGISFDNNIRKLRYDFRAFADSQGYLTTNKNRYSIKDMFPDLYEIEPYNSITYDKLMVAITDHNTIDSKQLLWGYTNKTFSEIIEFEKTLHKSYILGVYDCRHYVHDFTEWCGLNATPIWELYKIWDQIPY